MLKGSELIKYVSAGITTEHEATNSREGLEKLMNGMKLMIRSGSSEKNMEELICLAKTRSNDCFLVSDDRNPIDLKKGHVDSLIREAIEYGLDPITAIKCCTINPARHYGLNTGIIEPGKSADFVVVKNLRKFKVKEVYIDGELVAKDGKCLIRIKQSKFPLCIKYYKLNKEDFKIRANGKKISARVIKVVKNQIYTKSETAKLKVKNGFVQPSKRKKICYLAVVNRYKKAKPSLCFVKGFYVNGALASSISHDSHNIISVGNNPEDMLKAVSVVMKNGGIAFVKGKEKENIPLEIAGLMTNASVDEMAAKLKRMHKKIRKAGCKLKSPLMQLSFLSLLVIPELKLSDKGLFDSKNFKFVNLFSSL